MASGAATMTAVIIGLSVWFGFVAASIVWFAWGIAENLRARFAAKARASGEPPEPETPS
jgi:hypothetical protein